MSADSLIVAPYGVDPLPLLAKRLLVRHADELPDLTRHVALFPHPGAASRFRAALLDAARQHGINAILPPWIGTLSAWLTTQQTVSVKPLTPAARELVLLQALAPFSELTERFSSWSIIDGVLPLFDELTSNVAPLPRDRAGIRQLLSSSYGITGAFAPLDQEANWVYELWHAWGAHLEANAWQDATTVRCAALAQTTPPADVNFYVAADIDMSTMERDWLRRLHNHDQLTVLVQSHGTAKTGYHPDQPVAALLTDLGFDPTPPPTRNAYGHVLDEVFRTDNAELGLRARTVAHTHPQNPLRDRLALYVADDLEQEARAIELQIRRWRLAGLHDIAIVTHDRKLARRIRALLERANISLHDSAGWALSTTSAATALARWLECCEQQFAYRPLLDFLKSPFVTLNLPPDRYGRAVRQLEHGLIRRYRIHGGLERYRAAWRHRPAAVNAEEWANVGELLDQLAAAAEPLQRLVKRTPSDAPAVYLARLDESLKQLGLVQRFQADPAGRELLAALGSLRVAPPSHNSQLTYPAFRNWLQRELERRRFRPIVADTNVRLMGFADSDYCHFDAVIIAGCTADHMPGRVAPSPFFNEAVRATLGLPTTADRMSRGLHHFRRLLEAAPHVLLSYRRYDARESLLPSPWLERLVAFHRLAYGAISDGGLTALVRTPQTLLAQQDAPLPSPAGMPAPRLTPDLLPKTWTASAHQRLLDCPFQFSASDVLGLAALDTVPEEIERSHYGERVHRILHAFHHGVAGLPGPWNGPLLPSARAAAEQLLRDIAHAVFAQDLSHRFTARAWLYHWQDMIPAYLDWLQSHWAVGVNTEASELKMERTIYIDNAPLVLRGRIDRMDRGVGGKIVIDYKTGQLPDLATIISGEQIQLAFYTLLLEAPVQSAFYLGLRERPINAGRELSGDVLASLRKGLLERVITMANAIAGGAGLPAWGDHQTCERCRYEGTCRRALWTTAQ